MDSSILLHACKSMVQFPLDCQKGLGLRSIASQTDFSRVLKSSFPRATQQGDLFISHSDTLERPFPDLKFCFRVHAIIFHELTVSLTMRQSGDKKQGILKGIVVISTALHKYKGNKETGFQVLYSIQNFHRGEETRNPAQRNSCAIGCGSWAGSKFIKGTKGPKRPRQNERHHRLKSPKSGKSQPMCRSHHPQSFVHLIAETDAAKSAGI